MQHKKPCLFCELDGRAILGETMHLFAIEDRYPVTPKHCLIIPKRHCSDFFELEDFEYEELFSFLKTQADRIRQEDSKVEAFNIGMNCGEAAGQTIFHCHVHLIPRRWGDIKDPKGGVRAVIADKKHYLIRPT